MKHRFLNRLLAAALSIATAASEAARPLATDDPGVLADGDCEGEVYAARLRLPGAPRQDAASMQVTCGLGASTQVAFAYGRADQSDPNAGGRRESVLLGAKTQWFDDGRLAVGVSAGGVLGRATGEPFYFDSWYVAGLISVRLAEGWTSFANLGAVQDRNDRTTSLAWNLALEYAVAEGLSIMGECYGDHRSQPWAAAGVRWAVDPRVVLGASYAVQADSLRQRLVTVGATFPF